jgi:hypothetical protein
VLLFIARRKFTPLVLLEISAKSLRSPKNQCDTL